MDRTEIRRWICRNGGAKVRVEYSPDGVQFFSVTGTVGTDADGATAIMVDGHPPPPAPFPPEGVTIKKIVRLDEASRAATPSGDDCERRTTFDVVAAQSDAVDHIFQLRELSREMLEEQRRGSSERQALLEEHRGAAASARCCWRPTASAERQALLDEHRKGSDERHTLLQITTSEARKAAEEREVLRKANAEEARKAGEEREAMMRLIQELHHHQQALVQQVTRLSASPQPVDPRLADSRSVDPRLFSEGGMCNPYVVRSGASGDTTTGSPTPGKAPSVPSSVMVIPDEVSNVLRRAADATSRYFDTGAPAETLIDEGYLAEEVDILKRIPRTRCPPRNLRLRGRS